MTGTEYLNIRVEVSTNTPEAHPLRAYPIEGAAATTAGMTVPGSPSQVQVSAGEDALTVTWQPPVSTGAAQLTGYDIQAREIGSSSWIALTHSGTSRSATITSGLDFTKAHEFQVRARNPRSSGEWSTGATWSPASSATIEVSPASVAEDAAGDSNGDVMVTVDAVLAGDARTAATTLTITVTSSDATRYEVSELSPVTIAAGATSGSAAFKIDPVDNNVSDGTLNVTVTAAGSPPGWPAASDTFTINDDETASTAISVSVTPESVQEGAGPVSGTVTVTLDAAASTQAISVDLSASPADATRYEITGLSTALSIAAGQVSSTRDDMITPVDDAVSRTDLTVTITADPDVANWANATDTLVVTDDDTPSTGITLTFDPVSMDEGAEGDTNGDVPVSVTVAVDAAARTEAVSVEVSTAGAQDRYDASALTLTIPAEATSASGTLLIDPVDNSIDDGDATVTVTATPDVTGWAPASGSLEIVDDDVATVALELDTSSVPETAGATNVSVSATLDLPRTVPTTVTVSVPAGGNQYSVTVTDATISFAAGETTSTDTAAFVIDPTEDEVDEFDQAVNVLGSAGGVGAGSVTFTIVDDDEPSQAIMLSVTPDSVGEEAGTTQVQVTVALDGSARTLTTQVLVEVTPVSSNRYSLEPADGMLSITIPARAFSATGSFNVTPTDNGDTSITVGGAAWGLGWTDTATVVIGDDDPTPVVRPRPTRPPSSGSSGSTGGGSSTGSTTTHPEEPPPGARFTDDDGSVHEASIEALARAGITAGCSRTEQLFCPDAHVTRAQMAVFLVRALKETPSSGSGVSFSDVASYAWYRGYVARLAELGVTSGFSDQTFRPDDPVTRAQMAVFLVRAVDDLRRGNVRTYVSATCRPITSSPPT